MGVINRRNTFVNNENRFVRNEAENNSNVFSFLKMWFQRRHDKARHEIEVWNVCVETVPEICVLKLYFDNVTPFKMESISNRIKGIFKMNRSTLPPKSNSGKKIISGQVVNNEKVNLRQMDMNSISTEIVFENGRIVHKKIENGVGEGVCFFFLWVDGLFTGFLKK